MMLPRLIVALTLALSVFSACTTEPSLVVAVAEPPSVVDPVLRTFAPQITAKIETVSASAADTSDEFDVLWDEDARRAAVLKRAGRLAPLPLELRALRPEAFRDPDGYWEALTADVRVIAYDPARIDDDQAPTHVRELAEPRWRSQLIMGDPHAGSGAWHAAALAVAGGGASLADLAHSDGVTVLASEREVIRALLDGGSPLALVDGEQAFAARERGHHVGILIPDQDEGGAVLRATIVALSRRAAANPSARALVAYLLSASVGRRLTLMTNHIALLPEEATGGGSLRLADVKVLPAAQAAVAERLAGAPAAASSTPQP
jgi:iron(III) transport system substrate-binding protein